VPAQERIWLHDQQRLAPCLHDPGEQQQAQSIRRGQARALGLALEHRQRLMQQRVRGDPIGVVTRSIGHPGQPD
jgi:hypothetical protein